MLLSLLPTTALAAAYNSVGVNNVVLKDGYYLETNGATEAKKGANTAPATYVAWYKNGVLTLKGYNGKDIVTQGAAAGELTVKLIGTNSINNGSLVSDNGGNIIVTSDSSGTLSITKTISDSNNSAIGIEAGYSSSYTTGSVTIKGDAEVTINMTHNGTKGYDKAYGIFAKENITISENASVDITCATPSNTTGGGNCNGLRADKNVTINTNGTIKIDVTNAGRDENNGYSYGVYPMGTATLTKVGNMEVQWKKDAKNTSYSGGAFTRGATFSETDHAINEDTTNCYASYRKGTPRKVTVQDGQLTGPGVPNARVSGSFLQGDKVNITPDIKKSWDDQEIPFKEWTSSDVTLDKSATTASNSFTVPGKDVTVTAKHSPFVGAPTFTPTGTTGTQGTLTFKTLVKADAAYEGFRLVKDGEQNDESKYISFRPDNSPSTSPYEYSYETRRLPGVNQVDEGNYYVVAYLNNDYYLSEKFTVDYTAAPTVTYPDHVVVYNANKGIIGLGDKQYLATNDATSASTGYNGTQSYVARYDKSSGTLYLKGYQGVGAEGGIVAAGDLNIKVERDSSFTTSRTSTDDLMGIQASGKLNISGSGKLTVSANSNSTVYGIYAKEGVTISAPLDVTVKLNDSTKNRLLYGIYTRSGAISLSGEEKAITVTGGTGPVNGVYNAAKTPAITGNGNIDISGKLTVDLINGSSNVGICTDGGTITLNAAEVNIPSNFIFGIYNYNGDVIIQNNSNVTLTSAIESGEGIYANYGGDLIIKNSTVKVSAHGYAANPQRGKLSIENSDVDLTLDAETYRVVNTANNAENTIDLSSTGSVTLTASGEQTSAMIGGKVSITSGTKCEKGTYYDSYENFDGLYDEASNTTVLQFVHEDPASTTYTVSFDANGGTGTMADVTGVSGEYTLPANGFTAPDGKQFKCWSVGGSEKAAGDKITVTANTTVTAVWENISVVTYTVSGTATSFGSDTDNVILQLIAEGYSEADYEVFVQGNSANYSIAGVAPGTYTMKVMKNNHVTREYTVTVGAENVTQDVKIHLKGDIDGNGTVTTMDYMRVNSHAKGITLLTDYALKCADVVGTDGKVTTMDAMRVNAHARGTAKLW